MELILFIHTLIMLHLVYIWISKQIVLIGKCTHVHETMDKRPALVVDFRFRSGDAVAVTLIQTHWLVHILINKAGADHVHQIKYKCFIYLFKKHIVGDYHMYMMIIAIHFCVVKAYTLLQFNFRLNQCIYLIPCGFPPIFERILNLSIICKPTKKF